MSALDADDLAIILEAHAGLTATLADPAHFFATAPDDRRTVRWTCSCLATGEALDVAVRAAGNRHLAEVIAAAIQLSQRGPGGEGGSLASDELAERYVRSARLIVSTIGRIPPPNTLPWVRWRIDPDVLELLQRAGKLQARESAGDCWSELLGIRVEPEPAIDAQTVPVTVPKALAVRAINAFADTGRGLDTAEMVAAVRRATEMDGDSPTFELVVS
jgi:hypothetical protein